MLMFKGNINDDVNLYQSRVLKNAKHKLVQPIFIFFYLLREIRRPYYGIDQLF